jgi:microcystin-dependent protein
MARCGCASDTCSCTIAPTGAGIEVTGAGSERNPYVINSTVADIETGFNVQQNNVDVIRGIHQIDFRGSAFTIAPGVDEAVVTVTVPDPTTGAIIPTGAIWMFGGGTAPNGWLLCNGGLYDITTYSNLFAVLGTTYGGDGISTFGVPNMGGVFPVGTSPARAVGSSGGSAALALSQANLPPHQHVMTHDHPAFNTGSDGGHQHVINRRVAAGNVGGVAGGSGTGISDVNSGPAGTHTHSANVPNYTGNTGSGSGTASPIDITPPYLALAFIIKS